MKYNKKSTIPIIFSSLLLLPLSSIASSFEENNPISSELPINYSIEAPSLSFNNASKVAYEALPPSLADVTNLAANTSNTSENTNEGSPSTGNSKTAPDEAEAIPEENASRVIYKFNKDVDSVTLRPVAKIYLKSPSPVKKGVSNFVDNLRQPANAINFIFQGNLGYATNSIIKFSFNTVLGFAGLLDILPVIPTRHTNVSQTVRTWGVSPGSYTVIPLLGPAHIIEYATIPVDLFLDPIGTIDSVAARNSVSAVAVIKARSDVEPALVIAEENSLDEYLFVKSAYIQKTQNDVDNLVEARQTQFEKSSP